VLRALHAVEHTLRAVGERHHGVLHVGRKRAMDDDIPPENASKGRIVSGFRDDADVVEKA
jgi:hypothetical protein